MVLPRLTAGAALACALLVGCADPDLSVDEASDPIAGSALALRPDAVDGGLLPPVYEPRIPVRRHDAPEGHFRVHYVEQGVHAVPRADSDGTGVPDYVEQVASEHERVLAFYRDTLGFAAPADDGAVQDGNGGDARFDVYLLDFPTGADGSFRSEQCGDAPTRRCSGYMLQENDFDGRGYASLTEATRILASHELFHAVQGAYGVAASGVLDEATAVWASERYDPSLDDFEQFVGGYLARPERSLLQEPSGPPDAFSYGSALLFRQLTQRLGDGVVRALWEERARAARDEAWSRALDRVLARDHQTSLAAAFADFARWNLYTGPRADPRVAYTEGARYPNVAEQTVSLPYYDEIVRMLPLSARYFVASAGGSVRFAAVAPVGTDAGALRLLLAEEANSKIVQVAEGAADQPLALPAPPAPGARVHAVLIDTRPEGPTLRASVCLGDDSALAPCGRSTNPPEAGTSSDDVDAPSPANMVDAGVEAMTPSTSVGSDGGCSVASRGDYGVGDALGWFTFALTVWYDRSRRRRRDPATKA